METVFSSPMKRHSSATQVEAEADPYFLTFSPCTQTTTTGARDHLISFSPSDIIHPLSPAQARFEVGRKASKRKLFGQPSDFSKEPRILFDDDIKSEWVNFSFATDSENMTSSNRFSESLPPFTSSGSSPSKRFIIDASFRDYLRSLGHNPIYVPNSTHPHKIPVKDIEQDKFEDNKRDEGSASSAS